MQNGEREAALANVKVKMNMYREAKVAGNWR
jgi:hypothetical protein